MLKLLKRWASRLKNQLTALYYARQHPCTPWYCKWLIGLTLLYALSPIDLIPDFIPVLGLLDDLLLLPLAVYTSLKLLPPTIWEESLAKAQKAPLSIEKQKWGILLFVVFWLLMAVLLLLFFR